MGEYACLNGVSLKLGTCDAMYYVRRDEAEAAEWSPMHTSEGEAYWDVRKADLLTAPGIFWRFPLPEEDGQNSNQWQKRHYILESPSFLAQDGDRRIEMPPHGKCSARIESRAGTKMPRDVRECCPFEALPELPLQFVLCSQRWFPDCEYTVFGCLYCDTDFSLRPSELEQLVKLNSAGGISPLVSRLRANTREVGS